jgi:hypothetical protein
MSLGGLVRATLLVSTVLAGIGPLSAAPAWAQSLEEMKAQIQALQRRIEQLETQQKRAAHAQRQAPAPAVARATPAASAAQVAAAQRAAAQAQQAAAQAQRSVVQAKQEAAQAKETAAAEVKAAYAPPPGKPAGTFRIPGTEVAVRLYGFAKVNGIWDLTTQNRSDTLSAQSIPLFGTANQRTGGSMQLSARRSRLGFETWTPINDTFGEFHSLVEMDFAGQNTDLTTQATSSSYTPRLRKAYVDFGRGTGGWGSVLFGQDTTLFGDQSLLPIQWMSDWDFVGLSNNRQGQFRYTYGFGDGLSAAFGVESPYSDITTSSGTSYPDANGGAGFGFSNTPDFTGRVQWKQGWGLLALRGVVRPQIELNNQGAALASARFSKSTTGYGLGVTAIGSLLDGSLVLMASANGGSGIGRYLDNTAAGFSAVSNAGLPGVTSIDTSIDAVTSYGGMVGIQYFFTPTLRTNMALGGARLIMPSYTRGFGGCVGAASPTGSCSAANKSEWAGSINLVWSPFKAVDIGLEYQHVERVLQGSFSTGGGNATTGGIANRIQLTGIGRF